MLLHLSQGFSSDDESLFSGMVREFFLLFDLCEEFLDLDDITCIDQELLHVIVEETA